MKTCCYCKRKLPLTLFRKNPKTKDKLQPYCASCVAMRAKKRYEERKLKDISPDQFYNLFDKALRMNF